MTRERLPDTRTSITRKFRLPRQARAQHCPACGHRWEDAEGPLKVWAIVGRYPDGRPGELFLSADRVGTTVHGLLDAAAMALSVALQHGVPLGIVVAKWRSTRFGPAGLTGDPEFPIATSILDVVAQWLGAKFPPQEET